MKLSDHFTLEEFTASNTAIKNGIDNQPRIQEHFNNLARLASEFEKIRSLVGDVPFVHATDTTLILQFVKSKKLFGIITIAYRVPELNALLPGAAKKSAHMEGRAIDFHPPENWTHDAVQQALKAHSEIETDRCLEERNTTGGHWLHFQIAKVGDKPLRLFEDLKVVGNRVEKDI